MFRKKTFRPSQRVFVKANHQLRFPQARVLSETGEFLGIMSTSQAMLKAREQGQDLVLVTEQTQPPVVKIIDLAKFKYQLKQKQAADRKKSKIPDTKEVRFSPFIGENDYQSRLRKVKEFIGRGDKVRLSLIFQGRLMAKKEFGYLVIKRVVTDTNDIAKVEIEPKLMGKKLIAQIMPNK